MVAQKGLRLKFLGRWTKAADRACFIVKNLEHGFEFRDLKQASNSLRYVHQLHCATAVDDAGATGDQLACTGAVNVVHVSQVDHDLLVPLLGQILYHLAESSSGFAENNPSCSIDYSYVIHVPRIDFQIQRYSSESAVPDAN